MNMRKNVRKGFLQQKGLKEIVILKDRIRVLQKIEQTEIRKSEVQKSKKDENQVRSHIKNGAKIQKVKRRS